MAHYSFKNGHFEKFSVIFYFHFIVEVLQELLALFRTFDKDKSGSICFEEFLTNVRVNEIFCVSTFDHVMLKLLHLQSGK